MTWDDVAVRNRPPAGSWTPKVVASDLDGTLLRSDLTVSARARDALDAAEAAGVLVVLVTGRPPRWMPPVIEQTGRSGLAICANGALVIDLATGATVREHTLTAADAHKVAEALREAVPELAFAVEQVGSFGREPAYARPALAVGDEVVDDISELLAAPVAKLLARHPSMAPAELLAVAQQVVGDLATLTYSSTSGMIEISGSGVSKAFALEHLAADYGAGPQDVLAFGDMPNDLPMLGWAGHGVAVANAHPDVRAIADEVTAANDDDGVAMVLERIFG